MHSSIRMRGARRSPLAALLLVSLLSAGLSGCAVVTVAGAAVGVAATATGLAVDATVGTVRAVGSVISPSDDKK